MEDVDDYLSGTRREFIAAAGSGATALIAGCSGDGDTTSNSSTDQTVDSTQGDSSGTQKSEGSDNGTTKGEEGTDSRYDDPNQGAVEDEVEAFLSDGNGAVYNWFEFDEPNAQLEFSEVVSGSENEGYDSLIASFNYIANGMNDASNEFPDDVEAVYLAFTNEGSGTATGNDNEGNYTVQLIPLSSERYDSGYRSTSAGEHSQDVLTRFLDENVVGASDVSDDMPQEYLDLVG